jgi:hypothetical protein
VSADAKKLVFVSPKVYRTVKKQEFKAVNCPKCDCTQRIYRYHFAKYNRIKELCSQGHFIRWVKMTPETIKLAEAHRHETYKNLPF